MTTSQEISRLFARSFTRPVFAAMARTGDYRAPFSALLQAGLMREGSEATHTIGSLFDRISLHLSKNYRNEYIYKNDLASKIIFGRHSPKTAGLQIEIPIGRSIVDVAVANGTTTAYEIKTEFDTSRRLNSQTTDYLKAFDQVYVVTHPAHVTRFEKELDPRVGVIVLTKTGTMRTLRSATGNAEHVDPCVIFRCLRRGEYLHALNKLVGSVPSLPNGLIHAHCESLFSKISQNDAHRIFTQALRSRTTDQATVEFIKQLPASLRALGYGTPLSARQRGEVLALLSKKVSLTLSI